MSSKLPILGADVAQLELFRWLVAIGGEIPSEVYRKTMFDSEGKEISQDPTPWEQLQTGIKLAAKALQSGALVVSEDGTEICFTPMRKWAHGPITLREPTGAVIFAATKEGGQMRAVSTWATLTQDQLAKMMAGDVGVLLGLYMCFQVCSG